MTAVTVDLADLETIVFATAAIKTIEGSLAQRKQDPFIRPHLDFSEAHDRLSQAMRNATRAEAGTLVGWDEPLTEEEAGFLDRLVAADTTAVPLEVKDMLPKKGEAMSFVHRCASKGIVVVGQIVTGALWAGASAVSDIKVDPRGYAVKITDRGRAKLTEYEAAQKPALPAPERKRTPSL